MVRQGRVQSRRDIRGDPRVPWPPSRWLRPLQGSWGLPLAQARRLQYRPLRPPQEEETIDPNPPRAGLTTLPPTFWPVSQAIRRGRSGYSDFTDVWCVFTPLPSPLNFCLRNFPLLILSAKILVFGFFRPGLDLGPIGMKISMRDFMTHFIRQFMRDFISSLETSKCPF